MDKVIRRLTIRIELVIWKRLGFNIEIHQKVSQVNKRKVLKQYKPCDKQK